MCANFEEIEKDSFRARKIEDDKPICLVMRSYMMMVNTAALYYSRQQLAVLQLKHILRDYHVTTTPKKSMRPTHYSIAALLVVHFLTMTSPESASISLLARDSQPMKRCPYLKVVGLSNF